MTGHLGPLEPNTRAVGPRQTTKHQQFTVQLHLWVVSVRYQLPTTHLIHRQDHQDQDGAAWPGGDGALQDPDGG